jgi:squalene cyclase
MQVLNAIQAGRVFLRSIQRPDGSWYGSWGNCFTYGTWFGIEGLICAGECSDAPSVRRAVQFLLDKQNANGGWGESYLACINKAYPEDGTGKVRCVVVAVFLRYGLLLLNFCSSLQLRLIDS